MSAVTPLDAMRAVMTSRLDASTSHVLLVWASHVNEAGRAWPSVGRLVERTRLSTSSVKRSLKLLRASGVLVPEGESAAATTIYRLDLVALDLYCPPEVHRDTPVHSEPRSTVTPPQVHRDTPGGSPWTSPRSTVTPKGVSEEDREEVMEEDTPPTPSGGLTVSGPLALVEPVDDPDDAALPAWSAKAHRPRGVSRAGLVRAVAEVLEVIQGRPGASATAAKPVLSLWKALEYPPLRGLVGDLRLIAEAAHDCPDRLFARDIRAEGWAEGVNREHDPTTICRHDRWDARLQAARAWEAAGKPTARGSPTSARASPSGGSWVDDLRALREPDKPPRKRIDPDHPEEPPWPT